jgi:hypothetical protein
LLFLLLLLWFVLLLLLLLFLLFLVCLRLRSGPRMVARVLDGWKFLQSGLRRRPRRCGGGGTAASAW